MGDHEFYRLVTDSLTDFKSPLRFLEAELLLALRNYILKSATFALFRCKTGFGR